MRSMALNITITGHSATGKSAVAQAVSELLRNYGMSVINDDSDDAGRPRRALQLEHLLTEIGPSVSVLIHTERT